MYILAVSPMTEAKKNSTGSKIPEAIRNAVPKKYHARMAISWNKTSKKYYVSLRKGTKYDPQKKRGIDLREPLGSVSVDGEFKFSDFFLKNQSIRDLTRQLKKEQKKQASAQPEPQTPAQEQAEKQKEEHIERAVEAVKTVAATVEDPRQAKKVTFSLNMLLAVVLLACMAGYTDCVRIATYWRQFRSELGMLFEGFPEANISHDTINRVFRLIKKERFLSLMALIAKPLINDGIRRFIHFDGQAVRASKSENCPGGRYIFNVYDSTHSILLTQKLIDEKENEITVAVEVLSSLFLRAGDIVTADALNTQKALVDYLVSQGVHYCLAVKDNHPKLHSEVRYLLSHADRSLVKTYHSGPEKGHGRIEERTAKILPASLLSKKFHKEWQGLKGGAIVEMVTKKEPANPKSTEKASCETRYFITDLPYGAEPEKVEFVALTVRRHWSIENNLHWELDNHYDQDKIQIYDDNCLSNETLLNKLSLSILHQLQNNWPAELGARPSIPTLQQVCSTPMGAAVMLGRVLELLETKNIVKD